MKLRIPRPEAGCHVVLVEPEIPQNTGNIARLCAATGSRLHLVGELGFDTDEKAVRRAGLDHWHLVRVEQHRDLGACLASIGAPAPLLFTANTTRSFLDAPLGIGAVLVFGKESSGLPVDILAAHPDRTYAIPTVKSSVRSLNLANAVAVVVYQALREGGALDATFIEP